MKKQLSKICAYFFLCLNITTQVYAECKNNDPYSYDTQKNAQCCCQIPCYFNPCIRDKKKEFLIKGDILYWVGSLCGLEGAFGKTTINSVGVDSYTTITLSQIDREPSFKWNPGFRIGAELLSCCLHLDTYWTHFRGKGKYKQGDQFGKWKVKYDTLDLLFGYKFYPCSWICLKPFIGARGAEIRQRLFSHLITTKIDLPTITTPTTDLNDKEHFWGIGPEFGIESNWYLGHRFSLFCTLDAVTYYGHVSGRYYDTDVFISLSTTNINNIEKKHCFNNLSTDATIGIRWDKYICTCDTDIHIMLKLGAEQHRIYDLSDLGADGSLSLDGVFAELGIGFLF